MNLRLLLHSCVQIKKELAQTIFTALRQVSFIKIAAMANHWQCVEDVIGSGFEPHTFCSRRRRVTTCFVFFFFFSGRMSCE